MQSNIVTVGHYPRWKPYITVELQLQRDQKLPSRAHGDCPSSDLGEAGDEDEGRAGRSPPSPPLGGHAFTFTHCAAAPGDMELDEECDWIWKECSNKSRG